MFHVEKIVCVCVDLEEIQVYRNAINLVSSLIFLICFYFGGRMAASLSISLRSAPEKVLLGGTQRLNHVTNPSDQFARERETQTVSPIFYSWKWIGGRKDGWEKRTGSVDRGAPELRKLLENGGHLNNRSGNSIKSNSALIHSYRKLVHNTRCPTEQSSVLSKILLFSPSLASPSL